MCCNDVIISAQNLGKSYQLYDKPHHRLLQTLLRGKKQFFREFWALQGVSFELHKGESLGILGRNGAGKSTLLQLLSGVLAPTTGSLQVNGRVAALLELGSGFNPEFTGRENAYLNGSILGLTEAEMDAAMPEIERFAGVGDFFDQPVKLYSSGMMVRVAFAVQVQLNPDILIVDEALAVGDVLFQKKCYQRINELLASGTSLILVSHDVESVRLFAQQALLIDTGKMLYYGQANDAILAYQALLSGLEQQIVSNATPTNIVQKCFSNGKLEIENVSVAKSSGEVTSVFYSNDNFLFTIRIRATEDLDNLFVAIRIINKQGIKIYSWGTFSQDVARRHVNSEAELFYNYKLKKDHALNLIFSAPCTLGPDFYELQVATSLVDPLTQDAHQLSWTNEAAFFEVRPLPNYPFGGVCDMRMTVSWQETQLQNTAKD
ncbi:ABC transporter ATP-binding protein [Desulfovibrio cuneatus]|uniref:ABC transporter ATP-binding protein n=1 Tax=Desulfovibrio cuneatus TaxID=159728 RepID=UPI000418D934|nr:ABC transporter ATP-binding protein [Desulfovibrio cuneatus]